MRKIPRSTRIRCFVGLKFNLLEQIQPLIDDLKVCAADESNKLKIAAPKNLHITLKFLGWAGEDQLLSIKSLLDEMASRYQPLELRCRGVGFFKNSIWVGIENETQLAALTTEMNEAFAALGFTADKNSYVPHVTLARFSKEAKTKLAALQEKYAERDWGILKAEKMYLYNSYTLPEGAKYTIMKGFKFEAAD